MVFFQKNIASIKQIMAIILVPHTQSYCLFCACSPKTIVLHHVGEHKSLEHIMSVKFRGQSRRINRVICIYLKQATFKLLRA